ncbi:MAG: creatininase family protein [Synechococcaceae cyanobacterium RM1_1_27]|nr:creatininase family protein [Synechococcaceae cyanobacterium SM2_3_2]NJO85690.1 creatininase family protein [Synechococcaceae cyanobacterium RM1_1_27]
MTFHPRRNWQDMTTAEFAALDAERLIAILPVAAIEQHGPHLPVSVDATLNQGILERAWQIMPEHLPVTTLPLLSIGKSPEHQGFPGTLSLSAETLIRLWTEVGESVARVGVRKMLIFNSHGGQPEIMNIVALDLRVRLKMLVVKLSWFGPGIPAGLFTPEEEKHGIHAGAIETAMMLHLDPEHVQIEKAKTFGSSRADYEQEYLFYRPKSGVGFGWAAQDLHPSGACGDPTTATAEQGEKVVDHAARVLIQVLEDMDRYPLDLLRDPPLQ